jgi:hypothetical protein
MHLNAELFRWSDASILDSLNAHNSNWRNREVAHSIANTIQEARLRAICGRFVYF